MKAALVVVARSAPRRSWPLRWALPWLVGLVLLALWGITFEPTPLAVARAFVEELRSGRLLDDVVASLFRVGVGLTLATLLAVPSGLWLGHRPLVRGALMPSVNFFRFLSPIAWIPFAILWFGIGDLPAIFLIFLASFLPLLIAITAAVAAIPAVYFRVAQEYEIGRMRVTFYAVLPQLITALRVTAGVAWMVVVAAEMIAVRSGLGFLIVDSRNGLRMDLVVCGMIAIGLIGILLDRLISRLMRLPAVRWAYERG